jgi:outer membrane protein insertion porin family
MKPLLAIKKENEDLEKQVNKLNNQNKVPNNYIKSLLTLLFLGVVFQSNAQEKLPFNQEKKYILAQVNVLGKISYNEQTVVTFAGLEKGQNITVPGEEISKTWFI